jgi:hypothetical protein
MRIEAMRIEAMRIEVLQVPDCPNAAVLTARLAPLLPAHGLGEQCVEQRLVHDYAQALACGMRGSPTLLLDSLDPFACDSQPPSLSCRLYLDGNGRLVPAPSVAQLRDALAGKGRHDG